MCTKFIILYGTCRIGIGEPFKAMKSSRSTFKKSLKFCRKKITTFELKSEKLLAKLKTKKSTNFGKKVQKMHNKVNSSLSSDGTSNFGDFFEVIDKKYNKILNDCECQMSSVANDPKPCLAPAVFSLYDLDTAIKKIILGKRFENVHYLYLKHADSSLKKMCKLVNKPTTLLHY